MEKKSILQQVRHQVYFRKGIKGCCEIVVRLLVCTICGIINGPAFVAYSWNFERPKKLVISKFTIRTVKVVLTAIKHSNRHTPKH